MDHGWAVPAPAAAVSLTKGPSKIWQDLSKTAQQCPLHLPEEDLSIRKNDQRKRPLGNVLLTPEGTGRFYGRVFPGSRRPMSTAALPSTIVTG